jgi:hypothetical protein
MQALPVISYRYVNGMLFVQYRYHSTPNTGEQITLPRHVVMNIHLI